MSHRFNECENLGGHNLVVEGDSETDISKFSGRIICEWCGASTKEFESEFSIEDEFGDLESIEGILTKEEETEKNAIYMDSIKIRGEE